MTLIKPFRGLRPRPEYAADVAAPPYDVLNTEEARVRAAGKPCSFLHISKPEIDLPAGTNPYDASVYRKGADNLNALLTDGVLERDADEHYYIYSLTMGEHTQIGLVAIASVADYDINRIRKHEYTRPDKEDDRVRQIDALNAQTGPVFLTYRHDTAMDGIVNQVIAGQTDVDITADDGVRHQVWTVSDPAQIERITQIFDAMEALYIADGHHRSAAGSRVSAMRDGRGGSDYFLSVIFPDNQMRILDYNRVVTDLNGMSAEALLQKLEDTFTVTPSEQAVSPAANGEFGMYLAGSWYRLNIEPSLVPEDDPVNSLDVSLLANHLIEPVLGISDPRRDKRIDFVGGIRGLAELEKRVDSGEMSVAFSMYPTSLQQLMDVADADNVMPPKSTWFEPKLADGLISHVLD